MTRASPHLEIFNLCYLTSTRLGYDTYDYLPADSVSYPFIFIGEQVNVDRVTKDFVYGVLTQTIHIYHSYTNRGDVLNMLINLKASLRSVAKTDSFGIAVVDMNENIINDNSTSKPLVHAVLDVDFRFN